MYFRCLLSLIWLSYSYLCMEIGKTKKKCQKPVQAVYSAWELSFYRWAIVSTIGAIEPCLVLFCSEKGALGHNVLLFLSFSFCFSFYESRKCCRFSVFRVSSKCVNYGNKSRDYKIEIWKKGRRSDLDNLFLKRIRPSTAQ